MSLALLHLSLIKTQKDSFAKVYGHGIYENFMVGNAAFNRTDFTVENPKMAIWITAQEILACLNADIQNSTNIKQINDIGQKLVQNLIRQLE